MENGVFDAILCVNLFRKTVTSIWDGIPDVFYANEMSNDLYCEKMRWFKDILEYSLHLILLPKSVQKCVNELQQKKVSKL